MAKKDFLVDIDLNRNQLSNAIVQNLATAPTTPPVGMIYYDTVGNHFKGWDGTAWRNLDIEGGTVSTIVGITGTKAQFDTAVTDGNFLYVGDVVSNVSTQLSLGTINGTSVGITSDGSADDVILPQANTTQAGLLSAAKWNEIVANSLKLTADATNVAAAGAVMEADTTTALMQFVIDEDSFASDLATKVPTQQSTKAYVTAQIALAVASEMTFKGDYNAATNSPLLDATPIATAIGDMYVVTVAGTFFTTPVEVGDTLIAKQLNATLEAHWTIVNKNLDAASILASLLTVDGASSGLDADLLDGLQGSAYQLVLTNPVTGTGTLNQLAYWTSANAIGTLAVATYPSLTEIAYVKGVTSAIQTQLDARTKKYSATIGGATSATITAATHGLGTSGDFVVSVRTVSTGAFVDCEVITNASTGLVTLNFNVAPAASSIRVVIIG